jgi:hypothetical protein
VGGMPGSGGCCLYPRQDHACGAQHSTPHVAQPSLHAVTLLSLTVDGSCFITHSTAVVSLARQTQRMTVLWVAPVGWYVLCMGAELWGVETHAPRTSSQLVVVLQQMHGCAILLCRCLHWGKICHELHPWLSQP